MTDSNQPPTISKQQIDAVIALFSNNNFQEAIDNASKLMEEFHESSILQNITGACYAGLGEQLTAVECYKKAIAINPEYAKAHSNLGGIYFEMEKFQDSIESYDRSLEIDSNNYEAHYYIAKSFKKNGSPDFAIKSYKKALEISPSFIEALYGLGFLYQELGELDEAVNLYQKVIEINPNLAEIRNKVGECFEALGQLKDALLAFQKAVEINPVYSEAYNNLGNTFKAIGQLDDAIKSYKKALDINPEYPALHNNLGSAYKSLGNHKDAVKSYLKGLALNPSYIDILNNLGVAYTELGEMNEAINTLKKAIAIKPDYAEAYNNLGVAFNKNSQLEEAVHSFESALKINPDFPDPYNNLTVVFRKQGLFDHVTMSSKKAIDSMIKYIKTQPNDSDTYNNLGLAYFEIDSLDKAVESFEVAVSINPRFDEAYYNLGVALERLHRFDDAIKAFVNAENIKTDTEYSLGNILNAKMQSCSWDNFYNLLEKLEKKINDNKKIVDPFNLKAWIDDPALQRKATEIKVKSDFPKNNDLPLTGLYSKHSKIRIGYFSPDFRKHPVGFLTAELYEVHDREHFEIYGFSLVPDTNDDLNLRIKAGVDHFYDVYSMSHHEIVNLARSLEIDIAIDLAGFTADSRIQMFAMSVAPIQLSYIGYLGTMGADYYDYLIADPIMIPKESQKYYVEKIAYLPSFQVNDSKDLPPNLTMTRKDLGLPETGFVFCCFNNTYKIMPTTFDGWARILKSVEGSVLILYANNELSKVNLTKEIEQRGVDSSRLILGESIPKEEYLARYRVADLFLDTHPYNAGTTASDALKMGLPMLTMKGKSYQARMGASILNAVNLPELITHSQEEYESLAIELATNPDKLKVIKEKLASNLATAPLYDTKLFAKNIESAYTQMYERHHQGLEPDHIYVE